MNKIIFSNRWFVWAIAIMVIVGFGVWGFIQYSIIKMDSEMVENYVFRKAVIIDISEQIISNIEWENTPIELDWIADFGGPEYWSKDLEDGTYCTFRLLDEDGETLTHGGGLIPYKVGEISDGEYKGGDLITVHFTIVSMVDSYFLQRFVKLDNNYYYLLKNSYILDSCNREFYKEVLQYTEDSSSVIEVLIAPRSLIGSSENQVVDYIGVSDPNIEIHNKEIAFVDQATGLNVYYSHSDEFFIKMLDGFVHEYSLRMKEFVGRNKEITLNSGKVNEEGYDAYQCGAQFCHPIIVDIPKEELLVIGSNSLGDPLYFYKNTNDQLLQSWYDFLTSSSWGYSFKAEEKSFEEFVDETPLFLWENPFGDFIVFRSLRYTSDTSI